MLYLLMYLLYLRMRVYILYILYLRMTEFALIIVAHIILRMWDLRKWDLRHRALPVNYTLYVSKFIIYLALFEESIVLMIELKLMY